MPMLSNYSPMGQYALKTLAMSLAFAALSVAGRFFFPFVIHTLWFAELGLFVGVSLIVFRILLPLFSKDSKTLVNKYQRLKWIKLLLFVAFMGGYVWFVQTDARAFLLTFMIYYLGFTLLETYQIQVALREMNKN